MPVRKEKRQERTYRRERESEVVGERLSLRKNEVFSSSRGNREVITFFRETVIFHKKRREKERESCALSFLSFRNRCARLALSFGIHSYFSRSLHPSLFIHHSRICLQVSSPSLFTSFVLNVVLAYAVCTGRSNAFCHAIFPPLSRGSRK